MAKIHLLILTPEKKYLETEVDFISVKSESYWLGILPHHAPLLTTLAIDVLTLKNDNTTYKYALGGGILHILEDRSVKILANSIERKDEIDATRAINSKNRAQERIANSSGIDVKRAELSLARALNRLSVLDDNN